MDEISLPLDHNLRVALKWLEYNPNDRLFPSTWDGKNHRPITTWSQPDGTSNNPLTIKKWYEQHKEAGVNFCIAMIAGTSNKTVIDVDVKEKKIGAESFQALINEHGPFPPGLIIQTPSGGWHYYFEGSCGRGKNILGADIDLPGMVPVPGSFVIGKGHYVIVKNGPNPPLPTWVLEKSGPAKKRKEKAVEAYTDSDDPEAEAAVIEYLINDAPKAIENQNGDDTTLSVANFCLDLGTHPDKTLELMLEHWNETKAEPPWTLDELETKVNNAHQYRSEPIGIRHINHIIHRLSQVDIDYQDPRTTVPPDQPVPPQIEKDSKPYSFAHELMTESMDIDYLVDEMLEADALGVWFGKYASLKSFLAIHLAVCVASGYPFAGRQVEPGPVHYMAGEGRGAIRRRIKAAMSSMNMDKDTKIDLMINNNPINLSNDEWVNSAIIDMQTMQKMTGKDPKLAIVDTLANAFEGDENSTKDMNRFTNNLKKIKLYFPGIVLLVIHHTGHGDSQRARGSIALPANVDMQARVYTETTNEIPYVCLEKPSKMKDGEPPKDTWFKAQQVVIGYDRKHSRDITSLALTFEPFYKPQEKVKTVPKRVQNRADKYREEIEELKGDPVYRFMAADSETAFSARDIGDMVFKNGTEKTRKNRAVKSIRRLFDKKMIRDSGKRGNRDTVLYIAVPLNEIPITRQENADAADCDCGGECGEQNIWGDAE